MNALVFLVKMTLEEYFTLRDGIDKEKKRNESYNLSERTGRGCLVLSKDTTCGLYDSWNGSGSVLEIKLEKMSACHSVASLRQTMMAVMATVSGKFTAAVLIYGVIMPSN